MVNIELERVPCPSDDNVILKCANTRAFIGQQEVGDGHGGDLFVSTDCVSWIDAAGNGFALVYPTIALHGTCRDLTAFPHHCIYLMIDGKLPAVSRPAQTTAGDDEGNEDDNEEDEDGSEVNFTEVRFVPSPEAGPSLEELYAALSRGQSLNPDPNDDNSEDSEDEEGAEYDCEEEFEGDDHHNGDGNGHQFDDNEDEGNGHMEQ